MPENISPTILNALVAFAGGTVLGDVFLHLIPHAKMAHEAATLSVNIDSLTEQAAHAHAQALNSHSHEAHGHAHGHDHSSHSAHSHSLSSFAVEFAVLAGILTFFLLERVLNSVVKSRSEANKETAASSAGKSKLTGKDNSEGTQGHDHGSSHSHDSGHTHTDHSHSDHAHSDHAHGQHTHSIQSSINTPLIPTISLLTTLPPALLLHLLSMFSHSFLDSLALTLSFLSSPDSLSSSPPSSSSAALTSGLATSLAVFVHELPHRLGDRAVMLKHGASPQLAQQIELAGGIGGFAWGWIAAVGLVYAGGGGGSATEGENAAGGFVGWASPFAAGAMLYMSLVGVLGGLVGHDHDHGHEDHGHSHGHNGQKTVKESPYLSPLLEALALVGGVGLMAYIAVQEGH
ncbi:hypothetical protein HDU93_001703 [Gonapodya sp. JEL0774]|nr:hypothetical protein HDU93_001703 [Gonapodya sp. JEL0774]